MKAHILQSLQLARRRARLGFSFIEAIFTIAIIGVMSALVVSAISNASRDAHRVMARQQQAAVQSALTAWVMAQGRVGSTAQVRSLENVRTSYNALGTTSARFNLLVPNAASPDPNLRAGFIDQTTADHILDYTGSSTDKLKSAALENAKQHLALPTWQSGDFPRVDLVNE
jgi:type II secretory pathway pseudopilin PulG